MKQFFTFLFCIFLLTIAQSQNVKLLGTTCAGGAYSGGVFFKYTSGNNSISNKPFYGGPLRPNMQGVIKATDGNFYGMTVNSGDFASFAGKGCIYKRTPAGVTTVLAYFIGNNGALPFGDLLQASDGNLYGMTQQGGSSNAGVLFRCTLSGTLTVLVNFGGASLGSYPVGSLIQGYDGFLYGMAQGAGANACGTIFKCSLSGSFTLLHSFNGANSGKTPFGSLVQGLDSMLYGMTWEGGINNKGVIFKSNLTGVVTKLQDLSVSSGYNPAGALIQNSIDSLFYGLTYEGGDSLHGTEFKISKTGVFRKIHNFSNSDGTAPNSTLVQDVAGNMYGTLTGFQGNSFWINKSGVFKSDTAGNITILHSVNDYYDGTTPFGPLYLEGDTLLYGTKSSGGLMSRGNLFTCSKTGNYKVIFTMGLISTQIGNSPVATPILGSNGIVYGSTAFGGSNGLGTIYGYDTTLNVISTLASFNKANGSSPCGVIQATDGNLYGMTTEGGDSLRGVIFKCSTSGSITVLKHLYNAIGCGPNLGHLIQGTDGDLYGMLTQGGDSLNGVIFKISTSGVYTILKHLDDETTGAYPSGSLVQASDSNFYGMTSNGGDDYSGTLFRITSAGAFTKLASFIGLSDGAYPQGSLIQSTDGDLYGMCQQGGNWSSGTIFKSTLNGNITKILDFDGASGGGYPSGDLIEASDGNFYGCTQYGGTNNLGLLFMMTHDGLFNALKHLNNNTGTYPYASLLELKGDLTGFKENEVTTLDMNVYPNPVKTNLNITFTSSQAYENAQVLVSDISGKRILNVLNTSIENGKLLSLDVSNLPSACYLIQVITKDKSASTKFIKE